MPATAPFSVQYPAPNEGPYANVQAQRLVGGMGGTSIQPIGGSTDIEMMRGIAGMVRSNEAVAMELKETASQIRMLNERTVRMMSAGAGGGGMSQADLTIAVREGTAQALLGTAAGVLQAMQGMEGGGGVGAVLARPGTPAAPPATGPAPAPGQPEPLPQGRPRFREAEPLTPAEEFQRARGYSIGTLRQDLATHVGRRLSQIEVPENDERGQRVLGAATGAARAMAEGGTFGESVAGALPRGGAALLGRATAGFALARTAGNFLQTQREENAQYQQVLGGSNLEGMVERARAMRFGVSQFGFMDREAAGQLYQGVAQTGLRGADQRRALEFGTDAYRRFGMSVQESVQLIQTAAANGVTSFGFLTQSLQGVTQAAREAGINAQVMRQRFVENMNAAIPNAGVQGGVAMAGAQTQATAGFGRQIGQQMTFGGTNTESQVLMQSRMAGMTPNQYLAQQQSDPRGALATQDRSMRTAAVRLLGRRGVAMVADAVRAAGGAQNMTPDAYRELALRYMREGGPLQALQAPRLIEQMTGRGGLTPETAIPALMMALAGGTTEGSTSSAAQYDQQRASQGGFQVVGGGLQGQQREHALEQLGMSGGDLGLVPGAGQGLDQLVRNVAPGLMPGRSSRDEQRNAARIYWNEANRTGRAGGVSAALASETGFAGERRIRVKTAHGERLVTTDDALRYYRDQIDRGDATIEEGPGAGQSVAEALGVEGDRNLKVTSATNRDIGKHGRDAKDVRGGGSKVEISMTPELARWFRANPVGGTDPNAGRQPPASQTTPSGLPTDSARG